MSSTRIRELALTFTLCKVRKDGKKVGPLPLRTLGVTPAELGISPEEFALFEREINEILFHHDFGNGAVLVQSAPAQVYVPRYSDKDDPGGGRFIS